ncbi:aromatic ring-hydroxylating oxygenase subunit alpha [Nocardioides sp.]|uniref:aromatic ring-hydroxylating oxygenase subunit alpha n=1 Tax=Nocardioides sp. TaxID=35761 RepID=UPI003D0C1A1E
MSVTPIAASSLNAERVSERVLAHLERGLALPGDLYTDPALFAEEMRAVFQRQWVYAGHVSQLANAGDFLTVDVGGQSVIVSRDRAGELHGLVNVCRHRGTLIVDTPCGNVRNFVCPYHQWAYAPDGTLRGAPRMPAGFDREQYPLKRVHTGVWNGLVFVNHSPGEVDDLGALLEAPDELMAPFDIASARVAHTEVYEVAANWKLVWENSQECYHCNANHPEFIKTFDMKAFVADDDSFSLTFSGDRRMQCATFPLRSGAVSLTMTGQPASRQLLGRFGSGLAPYTAAAHLKPGFASVFSPDYGIVFMDVPKSFDRTEVRVQWLVAPGAEAGVDYDVENLKRVWDQTNRQDWALCQSVQRGVASPDFEPGPLSLDEQSVAGFYHSYATMMAAAGL